MSEEKNINRKRRDISTLVMLVLIILLLNFVGTYFFKRFDLTSEKRYTLSESTRKLLNDLDDGVYIKVYLEGDFNPAFSRLRSETKEMLDEFRAYSGNELNYEFINIYDEKNQKELESIQRTLYTKGIVPTELNIKTEKGNKKDIIFPGALVTYKNREIPWQIFRQQVGVSPDQCVNNSVQSLEYELSNTIRKLQTTLKYKVAFIQGHGELDTLHTNDIARTLKEYYDVDYVTINHQLRALDGYKAIVIAQPDSAYDEKDKFVVDQFVMRGGRILWCIDPVYTDYDSLRLKGFTVGLGNDLKLEDMLFSYGARINYNLVNDAQCASIPINRGFKGGAPDLQMYPWYYAPLVIGDSVTGKHPIVKNLGLIKFEFASTIDTISVKQVKKTILLRSSRYTRLQNTPARISLGITTLKTTESMFGQSFQPLAVLLEGTFTSVYKNRLTKQIASDSAINFQDLSKPTSMIVIGDGDVIKNEFNYATQNYSEMGFDKYMRQTFSNKTFILNCVNYLCDGADFLSVRARDVKLRLLDKKKIKVQAFKWKMINVCVPLLVLIISGLVLHRLRKKRFTS
ncbi:MAG: gliding motility-associated ABC transporter substrate-binding protein GldG [Bacteroidia bacterium]